MSKSGAAQEKPAAPATARVAANFTTAGMQDLAKWEERAQIADARARESEAVLRRVEADIKRIEAEARLRDLVKAKAPG